MRYFTKNPTSNHTLSRTISEQPRKAYATDLTDPQWDILQPLLPVKKGKGRNQEVDLREIVNAIFYVLRTGCQWRNLPHAGDVISGPHMIPSFIILMAKSQGKVGQYFATNLAGKNAQ